MPLIIRNALSTFGKQPCQQCDGDIVAPTWSEYGPAGRVRHLWACDACKYEFETIVLFNDDYDRVGLDSPGMIGRKTGCEVSGTTF
jgi:hypothetical protein